MYVMVAILTIFTSNDIVILTFTPFICYFAKNANMLICETTFLKGQNKSVDNHLYAYEAGIIARNANVDKLLLMHFWPSIDKSEYVDEASEYFNNVEAACENKKYVLKRS